MMSFLLLLKTPETEVDTKTSIENRKRKKCGKDEDIERALNEWFECIQEKDTGHDGPSLKQMLKIWLKLLKKKKKILRDK